MKRTEAQAILALFRTGIEDPRDPYFVEALELVARDSELAQWLAKEQNGDVIVATKLDEAIEVPLGLRNALLAERSPAVTPAKAAWNIASVLRWALPTLILLLGAVLFISRPADTANLADFRSEMIGFVRVPPALELKSPHLTELQAWLQTSGGLSAISVPANTQSQQPVGCRTLVFHGQKVALVCFLRKDHQLIHLLAVNRAALPHLKLSQAPEFVRDGEWMTAAWAEGDSVYLLATKGDRADLEQYL